MPELPEVEITRRGLAPHVEGRTLTGVVLRRSGLRWPFPDELAALLTGHAVRSTGRRGKFLLLHFDHGTLIIHLGMSGRLRLLPAATPADKHDHIDLLFGAQAIRMTDPRRFGAVLWHPAEQGPAERHPLLASLGIEPFDPAFDGEYLYQKCCNRRTSIKLALLSGKIVVGVGNIYASESLFVAGIDPRTPAHRITRKRCDRLAEAIRSVLGEALRQGGSSLRDFIGANGQPGYFQLHCHVYGRAGLPCHRCGAAIRQISQGQRSTFFCVNCQKKATRS
ncbi:MAG: mutM [Burkholderiaceae bacterium]|nr:mutM [Burkholderiaceae bacterium]